MDQQLLRDLRLAADAIYLDGFSPAKNADMWTPATFRANSRLAAPVGRVTGPLEERSIRLRGRLESPAEFAETDPSRGFVNGLTILCSGMNGPGFQALGSHSGNRAPWGPGHHEHFESHFAKGFAMLVQTEDLGVAVADGFRLLGRSPGAPPRRPAPVAAKAAAPAAAAPAPAKSEGGKSEGGKVFASPLARRLAKEAGIDVKVSKHRFTGNSRAQIIGQTDGMVKIIARKGWTNWAIGSVIRELVAAEYQGRPAAPPTLSRGGRNPFSAVFCTDRCIGSSSLTQPVWMSVRT